MPDHLRIEHHGIGASRTLALIGDLDLETAAAADTVLTAETTGTTGDIRLDCSALEFVGFAGVEVLVDLATRLAADRRRLVLTRLAPQIERVVDLAGLFLGGADGMADLVVPTAAARIQGGTVRQEFAISLAPTPDGVDVVVSGELDISTAPILRTALGDAVGHAHHVGIDLAAITFIDVAGLRVVTDARRALLATGRRLELVATSAVVDRLLDLTGLRSQLGASGDGTLV